MSSLPLSRASSLISSLKKIEKETEDIFLELADALPSLVQEMKRSLAVSDEAIRSMEQGSPVGSGTVSGLVTKTSQAVQGWTEWFKDLSERDAELFEQLRQAVGNLDRISRSIEHIRLDSEDMEIVSLNAMTVALKAGNAGRAFSYITEELKRLSNRTVVLSETVFRSGRTLSESFTQFEQDLEETRSNQAAFLDTFQTRISASFRSFEQMVEAIIEGSRDLRDRSAQLQDPIGRMMEAIQLQDLIRQSIDHIVLALEAIQPDATPQTTEALLDDLVFLRDIPPLAGTLIEDVAQQIDRSTATFLALTEEAEERLETLEAERHAFMNGTVRIADGREVLFEEMMQEMSTILDELVRDLNENLRRKEDLVSRSEAITGSVETLQSNFRTFHTLVNRFRSIDIAARIEVAKQPILRSMENSTGRMTDLTRKISNDVESSLAVTREFINSTAAVMDNYREAYREESQFAHRFQNDMQQHHQNLQSGRDYIMSVVSDFSLFTKQFFAVFSRSKQNGTKLQSTAAEIRGLVDQLETMKDEIEKRYQNVLRQEGLTEWKIEDTRLREIIERFTIFAHKQQAGELAGFDVEQGVAAGDITLF